MTLHFSGQTTTVGTNPGHKYLQIMFEDENGTRAITLVGCILHSWGGNWRSQTRIWATRDVASKRRSKMRDTKGYNVATAFYNVASRHLFEFCVI